MSRIEMVTFIVIGAVFAALTWQTFEALSGLQPVLKTIIEGMPK